jgi:hypothetical protein
VAADVARDEHVRDPADSLEIDKAAASVFGHRYAAEADDLLARPVERLGRKDHGGGLLAHRREQSERADSGRDQHLARAERHDAGDRQGVGSHAYARAAQELPLLRAPGVLLKAQRKFSGVPTASDPAKPPF